MLRWMPEAGSEQTQVRVAYGDLHCPSFLSDGQTLSLSPVSPHMSISELLHLLSKQVDMGNGNDDA